jgi:hypothetical protein
MPKYGRKGREDYNKDFKRNIDQFIKADMVIGLSPISSCIRMELPRAFLSSSPQ